MSILIVEDEVDLASNMRDMLEMENYKVEISHDGNEGLEKAEHDHDLIILDVMLPGKDGFQICQELRAQNNETPILMLTARNTTFDKVRGLKTGADDYMTKPFEFEEFLARVFALHRRRKQQHTEEQTVLIFGDFKLDTMKEEFSGNSVIIPLKTQEYKLLEFLVKNPGRVITRDELLDEVWGYDSVTGTRTVDVHIAWLRQKLNEEKEHRHIVTVHGRGYRFDGE